MNYNKVIGYVLLSVGILLIVLTLYRSYNIFTGISQPPAIFKLESVAASKSQQGNGGILQDLQKQITGNIANQVSQIVPSESVPKALNLFSWSTFAWLLVFAGTQISIIGTKLVKQ